MRYTIANLRQSLASDHGAQLVADALNDGDEAEAGHLLALGAPSGPYDSVGSPAPALPLPPSGARELGMGWPRTQEGLLMMVAELARTVK